ncbi:MAG: N-acyl homoserine lactonase family protein [Gammaproteobacteria bacterium]|nr:N-acyl homoserine lactonase family protein [Gammaproteobacteria bacterium]
MKMHILSGGKLRMNRSIYYADAARGEQLDLPVHSVLLRHAQGNVLFDTGCHPSVAVDAHARWGALADVAVPVMARDDNLIADLGALGLAPSDIDVVINSHYHSDHCGCNEFFKNASFFIHRAEFARVQAEDAVKVGYVRADWDHPFPLTQFDTETDVFGDDKLVIVPLPGHTPGMSGALANLDRDGSFLLASDAVSVRTNLDERFVPKNTWDADLFVQSLDAIARIERGGARVVCGHDLAEWHALKKGADHYA